jgi:hypothetical protein
MSVERANECRQKAEECVAHAQRAIDLADKATWLTMAKIGKNEASRKKGTTMAAISKSSAVLAPQQDSQSMIIMGKEAPAAHARELTFELGYVQ